MVKRILYGTLAIVTILTLFSLDAEVARSVGRLTEGAEPPPPVTLPRAVIALLQHGSVIPLGFGVVILLGSLEFIRLLRAKGIEPHSGFVLLMVLAIFLSPWLSAGEWLGADVAAVEGLYWPLVLLVFTVLGAGTMQILRRAPNGSMTSIAGTLTAVFYLGFTTSFALQIRSGSDSPGEAGVWLLFITLMVTKCSDIGAYFTGSFLGRHKLAPAISPGKSVEGAVGGILGSIGAALLFTAAVPVAVRFQAPQGLVTVLDVMTGAFARELEESIHPLYRALVFGALISISAQLGDLVESCFKRDAHAKDSGSVLPQFGGILDLIDSPIYAVPVGWFLLTRVWHVL